MAEPVVGLTAEQYRAVISVVDERVKEIRVIREDFDDLKAIVRELAVTQHGLAQTQARTEKKVEQLADAQARTEKKVEQLVDAQARTEKKVEQLADAQARTEKSVAELALAQGKTEKEMRNLAHQVGKLSDTVGFGLEDLGQWILPAYLEKAYGITGIKRCTRKFVTVNSKKAEIDLYAKGRRNGETVVVLGESRNRTGKTEVKNFAKQLRILDKAFKEAKFPLIFGFWAHPDTEKMAKDRGIEVICSYQLTREG